nr:uncharacterized protein LOC109164765 [Ipomoea trifida]
MGLDILGRIEICGADLWRWGKSYNKEFQRRIDVCKNKLECLRMRRDSRGMEEYSSTENELHRSTTDGPPPALFHRRPATTSVALPLATTSVASPPEFLHQRQPTSSSAQPPTAHYRLSFKAFVLAVSDVNFFGKPEHVDDIEEDVEDDLGMGTQVDNDPVSQVENDQVQSSGGEYSDEEADLESNHEDGDSDLERSPINEGGFVDVQCGNAENHDEEIRRARTEGTTENVDLGGEKDDVQSEYYDSEDPLSVQSEKEEVEASFEHTTNATNPSRNSPYTYTHMVLAGDHGQGKRWKAPSRVVGRGKKSKVSLGEDKGSFRVPSALLVDALKDLSDLGFGLLLEQK